MQTSSRADNRQAMTARQRPSPSPQRPLALDQGFAGSPVGQSLQQQLAQGSAANQAIADFLLRNPVRATAAGIEELAALAQTSTATLSRFARALGYAGFAALRGAMADALQDALQPEFHPVEKLRGALERAPAQGDNPVLGEAIQATLANLNSAASGLDLTELGTLARHILEAETVYTLGFGISAHLAAMLALDLQPFCTQCINVVEFGGTEVAAGRLMNIGERDLLIAMSFPRYASDAVTLARYARDRGARIVALTDSMASPLVPLAQHVLLAPAAHPVLSSSYVAGVMLAEALVASLMLSGRDHVGQASKLTEAISAYLYDDRAEAGPARGRKRSAARGRR